MAAMLSGVIMIVAFGFAAAAGLILLAALFRISGRAATAAEVDPGQADPEGG